MFKLVKRNDPIQGSDEPFISFRPEHIGFNTVFSKLAGVTISSRVVFYVDDEQFRVGFRFTPEAEPSSLALNQQGMNQKSYYSSLGELRYIPWIWAVCQLPARQRRFKPELQKTEVGKIWAVQLAPAFEIKRNREPNNISNDEKGIYRYRRSGEVVYIGRGTILDRLRQPDRKDWDFDSIEYSLVENVDDQLKWEGYWIERFKEENNGKLPIYNKISGCQ